MSGQQAVRGDERVRRHTVTWAVTALVAVAAAVPLAVGVRALLRATGLVGIDQFAEIQDGAGAMGLFSAEALRVAEGLTAAVGLGVGILCLVLTLGLSRLRAWAREGVMGVFGLGGGAVVLLALSGLDQGGPNAAEGLVSGVALLAVAALAASPQCARDVRRRERLRAQRREAEYLQRRRAAAASGRTRV